MSSQLPQDFLWGNSVSSMQTEGAWNEGGKGKSVYDIREAGENISDWKVGTDSYHRYKEDFDYMQELGMNCYRFQISWSRVFPNGDGEVNEEGLEFYDRFIDDLLERGIEPMICLYHFDMPLHLAEKYRGFLSRYVVDAFVRYGKAIVDRYKEKVKYWISFNEQNIFAMDGAFKIGGVLEADGTEKELYQIQHNTLIAHAEIANYIHETAPKCEIGGMVTYSKAYPATSKPKDNLAAQILDDFTNQFHLDVFTNGKYPAFMLSYLKEHNLMPEFKEGDEDTLAKMKSDWLSFSYYASSTINAEKITTDTPIYKYREIGGKPNPNLEATEWGWQIDPIGFRSILRDMYNRYKLPVFPIENGIGVIEELPEDELIQDDYRIEYHRDHLQAMKDAIFLDGVECIGYLGWGLIDILSSQGDMRKRYGLVYVNRENHDLKDMRRIPKKSFNWFKKVIESNGENLD
ncbi:glycoside hydrolase family 1 protein [Desemzia sp. RIT804]|uniref:glycoside hydrolase family 1 protein n=1 Tax=Desemzia sp. RIT 804 TaxID=2810209 RepID=UPI00194F1FB4|nr:glycoside hydrolase family 1 protein [Desemzia sp. RIT 804]MBM6614477.1 glycoside hydrolase family 1 protein [Desemzia sp. RIT 804]